MYGAAIRGQPIQRVGVYEWVKFTDISTFTMWDRITLLYSEVASFHKFFFFPHNDDGEVKKDRYVFMIVTYTYTQLTSL